MERVDLRISFVQAYKQVHGKLPKKAVFRSIHEQFSLEYIPTQGDMDLVASLIRSVATQIAKSQFFQAQPSRCVAIWVPWRSQISYIH